MPHLTQRDRDLLSDITLQLEERSEIGGPRWATERNVKLGELDRVFHHVAMIIRGSMEIVVPHVTIPERASLLLTDIAEQFESRSEIGNPQWREARKVTLDDFNHIYILAGAAVRGFLQASDAHQGQILNVGALAVSV